MDHLGGVDAGERGGHPDGEAFQVGGGQGSVPLHHQVEPDAVDVLGDQVRGGAVEVRVEHLRGAEPGDATGGAHLAPEAVEEGDVAGQLGADDLDGDARAGRALGQVDGAHPAGAETAEHAVGPDLDGVVRPGRRRVDRPADAAGIVQRVLAFDHDRLRRTSRPTVASIAQTTPPARDRPARA